VPDAGAIAVGQRADLVTIGTDRVRTAGTGADEQTAVFAAAAEDVTHVVVDGREVFHEGDREELGRELDEVIGRIWR
jgi:cytosine/adenosine deaminase-related metal-dependent hydrolase